MNTRRFVLLCAVVAAAVVLLPLQSQAQPYPAKPQRSPIFPDVPTIAESGYKGFEASVWYALMAPASTPRPVVDKLHAEVQKALGTVEVRERMTGVGGEVIPGNQAMLATLLHSERQRYANLVREANIKPD